jgi:hypothetical protein
VPSFPHLPSRSGYVPRTTDALKKQPQRLLRSPKKMKFFPAAVAVLDARRAAKSTHAIKKTAAEGAPADEGGPGRRARAKPPYHTRHELTGYIGWPFWQPKALPNSSKFCTVPFTLHRPGE